MFEMPHVKSYPWHDYCFQFGVITALDERHTDEQDIAYD